MLENLLLGLVVALTVLAIFRKRALLKENRELKDTVSSLERSQAGLISAKFNAIQSSVKNEEALVISETRGNELELDLDTLEAELQVARVMNANLASDLELLKSHLIKVVKTKLEEKVENKTTAVEILGDFEKELKKDDKKSKKSAKKKSK